MQEIDQYQDLTPPNHGGVTFFTFMIILSFVLLLAAGMKLPQPERTAVAPAQAATK